MPFASFPAAHFATGAASQPSPFPVQMMDNLFADTPKAALGRRAGEEPTTASRPGRFVVTVTPAPRRRSTTATTSASAAAATATDAATALAVSQPHSLVVRAPHALATVATATSQADWAAIVAALDQLPEHDEESLPLVPVPSASGALSADDSDATARRGPHVRVSALLKKDPERALRQALKETIATLTLLTGVAVTAAILTYVFATGPIAMFVIVTGGVVLATLTAIFMVRLNRHIAAVGENAKKAQARREAEEKLCRGAKKLGMKCKEASPEQSEQAIERLRKKNPKLYEKVMKDEI